MKINLLIFITLVKEQNEQKISEFVMKTFESNIRPVKGDIIDDPGFDPGFHNGYEVVKVTINYASNECFVSLQPLVSELEKIKIETYKEWHGALICSVPFFCCLGSFYIQSE